MFVLLVIVLFAMGLEAVGVPNMREPLSARVGVLKISWLSAWIVAYVIRIAWMAGGVGYKYQAFPPDFRLI